MFFLSAPSHWIRIAPFLQPGHFEKSRNFLLSVFPKTCPRSNRVLVDVSRTTPLTVTRICLRRAKHFRLSVHTQERLTANTPPWLRSSVLSRTIPVTSVCCACASCTHIIILIPCERLLRTRPRRAASFRKRNATVAAAAAA